MKRRHRDDVDVWKYARLYLEENQNIFSAEEYSLLHGLIRARDYSKLVDITSNIDPTLYLGHEYVGAMRQLEAFFKKNAKFGNTLAKFENAKSNFLLGEKYCRITNRKLLFYTFHEERLDTRMREVIATMRYYISSLLGSFENFLEELPEGIRLTSGATSNASRAYSSPDLKIRRTVVCTPGAAPVIEALSKYFLGNIPKYSLTNCNRIVTVPKDCKTDRTIACEPVGNLPIQLSCDRYLKRRLRRWGIDLSDQSTNQQLAKNGSVDGSLATIDLSMASDTMSLNLIPFLLPEEWSNFFMRLRCSAYKGVFGYGIYSKFSSMGNGLTFGLETLIFSAICKTVRAKTFSVYGDDIIVDNHKFEEVVQLLRWFGFRPNDRKSFNTGFFRESCGVEYLRGVNVRPFFVRKDPRKRSEIAHFLNGMIKIGKVDGLVWKQALLDIQSRRIPYVPYNDDTTMGIYIDIQTAYDKSVIYYPERSKYIPHFRGISTVNPPRNRKGLPALLLWHLATWGRKGNPLRSGPSGRWLYAIQSGRLGPESIIEDLVTSKGASDVRTERVRSVAYFPATPVPPHLYRWSELAFPVS